MAGNLRIYGLEDDYDARDERNGDEILAMLKGDEALKLMFFFHKDIDHDVESTKLRLISKENPPEVQLHGKAFEKPRAAAIMGKWKWLVKEQIVCGEIYDGTKEAFQKVKNAIRSSGNDSYVLPLPLPTQSKTNTVRIFSKDLKRIDKVKYVYDHQDQVTAQVPVFHPNLLAAQVPVYHPDIMAAQVHVFHPDLMAAQVHVFRDADLTKGSYSGKNESNKSGPFKEFNHSTKTDKEIEFDYNIVTNEGLTVLLYKKRITKLNVDAIVNTANYRLASDAGLARVISNAAGQKLERECQDIISRMGKMEDGSNVVTSAGHLRYKAVIHAVGPRWQDYKKKDECLKVLRDTVINILVTSRENKFSTVAMPPISSGNFAVPRLMCAAMYLKGILEFSEQRNLGSLKEFHIIDINQDVLDMVNDWHEKYLRNPSWLDIDSVLLHVSDPDKQDHGEMHSSEHCAPQAPIQQSYTHPKIINGYCGKIDIHIYTRDIITLNNIDTIVVSENGSFEGEGSLANALLSFGCDHYKKEYNAHKTNRSLSIYKQTEVITSSGGKNLPFKHVLHAIIRRQYGQQEEHFQKQLQATLQNVLEKANALDIRRTKGVSIAIPLIGLGTRVEDEIVWKCCISFEYSIGKFLTSMRDVQITEIHLVNNNDYITRILQTAFDCKQDRQPRPLSRRLSPSRTDNCYGSSKKETWQRIEAKTPTKGDLAIYMMSYKKKPNQSWNIRIIGDDDFADQNDTTCVICVCDINDPVELVECHHVFCRECIMEVFRTKPSCPVCGNVYGEVFGDQPRNGWADIYVIDEALPGYQGKQTYVINYVFPAGKQDSFHPEPGRPYEGINRRAFLPNTKEGTEVLNLLRQAFEQGLTFTIGASRTTGKEGVITWNDISHKTSRSGGPQKFGYPDPEYLMRVKEELASKGVVVKP